MVTVTDGEMQLGVPWPRPRFRETPTGVLDLLTGLEWTRAASLTHELVNWTEAHHVVERLASRTGLHWRLPSIMELESLTDCSQADPALLEDHPFASVPEACWSATTSGFDPDWAFCLYFHKGAVGVGYKPNAEFSVWAARVLKG